MTDDEIRRAVLDAIAAVAPDARNATPGDDEDLRDALELDSMDMLRVLVGVKARTGVEVPEADTPKFFTINGAVAALKARLG
jgi:acyl carrier protein